MRSMNRPKTRDVGRPYARPEQLRGRAFLDPACWIYRNSGKPVESCGKLSSRVKNITRPQDIVFRDLRAVFAHADLEAVREGEQEVLPRISASVPPIGCCSDDLKGKESSPQVLLALLQHSHHALGFEEGKFA